MSDQQRAQFGNEPAVPRSSAIREVPGTISVSEAATTLGMNERTIRRAIARGDLVASKQGRSFQITLAALHDFRTTHVEAGSSQPQLRLVESPTEAEPDTSDPVPTPLFGVDHIGRIALPAPLTLFVGRAREIPVLKAMLLSDEMECTPYSGPVAKRDLTPAAVQ